VVPPVKKNSKVRKRPGRRPQPFKLGPNTFNCQRPRTWDVLIDMIQYSTMRQNVFLCFFFSSALGFSDISYFLRRSFISCSSKFQLLLSNLSGLSRSGKQYCRVGDPEVEVDTLQLIFLCFNISSYYHYYLLFPPLENACICNFSVSSGKNATIYLL